MTTLPPPVPTAPSADSSSALSSPSSSKPRPFPAPLLRSFLRSSRLLDSPEVKNAVWERDAGWLSEKAEQWAGEVRGRMCDLEPTGFKYFCQVSVSERPTGHSLPSSSSLALDSPSSSSSRPNGTSTSGGGAGRAVLSTFWDPQSDVCVSEVFQNDTVLITVLAVAIRIAY
ncbi:hypothetical protein JCM8097_000031 [Rhodosporidiobolus ruineniae]